jgi:hypothetical protein
VTAWLAAVLVVAMSIDLVVITGLHMKVAAGLAPVLVVTVSSYDPYSCVTYEDGSWADSCFGGGCP